MCALADSEFALSEHNEIPTPTLGGTIEPLYGSQPIFHQNHLESKKRRMWKTIAVLNLSRYPALSDLPYGPIALRASHPIVCNS